MKISVAALCLLIAGTVGQAQNVVVNLLAPVEAASPGGEVRVDLVILNPTATEVVYETPLVLAGRLSSERKGWTVELRGQAGGGAQISPRGFSYRSFIFTVPSDAKGRLVLELDRPMPVRALIDVKSVANKADPEARIVSAPLSNVLPNQPAESAIQRTFAGRFAPHEPTYFIYGADAPAAKFQFSFKYRILGDKGGLGDKVPALRGLYAGFTQRSLWDLEAESSPFFDTSYMPEIMFESQSVVDPGGEDGFQILGYQLGARHESNGRDGAASRSLNILYFRPAFVFGRLDGWNLIVLPRVFAYIADVDNNPDIREYRGNAELTAVFGRNDRFALSMTGRLGSTGKKGSIQADLTIPVRFDKLLDFATYVLIQYWDGYGESLRTYNQRTSVLRAGFSLVR
ncbi:phospholipase A [Oleiharenicola lentus]|uniref:phospholipase A n=1 Tax=Oleiharenicola lentus TaxID=2508720 RepID=UPI003F666EFA